MTAVFDPAIQAGLALYRGYLRIFAESGAAPLFSHPAPVRNTGFELALEVVAREQICPDVVAFTLRSPTLLPAWTPGAHIDVLLPSGRQRQYSLCGDPADRTSYRIAVRLVPDGGGGSAELHADISLGDHLTVRGPRQAFWLVPEESYVFVAAGIGITPILPMVHAAARHGADWRLVYLGRSRQALPFLEDLERYGERVDVRCDDERGAPDIAAVVDAVPDGAVVYMCGPAPLMDAARARLRERGIRTRFHSERFSAPPVVGGEAFTLQLGRDGRLVQVTADESPLEALRRVVPGVTYSCRQGFCGTCKLRVLEGDIEHRDQRLLASERATHFLPCVSRAAGTLVVDL